MAQNLKPNRSDNRGGFRENAGRKPEGRSPYGKRVTQEERIELDEFLEKIRNKKTESEYIKRIQSMHLDNCVSASLADLKSKN